SALERIDAHQLAERDGQRLRAVPGVAGRATVAHPHVQQAVRSELELAAVVIGERLPDEEKLPEARRDRLPVARAELDDVRVAVPVGVVDVEAVVATVPRTERHGEQAAFSPLPTRDRMSRNVPATRLPTRYRIRPACSTTYSRRGSTGFDASAV